MALPNTGAISLNDVNVELNNPGTSQIGMNDAAVRTLFQVPSGAISMSDGYGKASETALTISSPQNNLDLYTYATGAGWPGSTALKVTINPGVYINGTSTGNTALSIPSSISPAYALTVINNGVIVGRGGSGGTGGSGYMSYNSVYTSNGGGGGAGGRALSVSRPVTFTNNGTIAGGGGGGGGGGAPGSNPIGGCSPQAAFANRGGGGGGGRSSNTNAPAGSPGNFSKNPNGFYHNSNVTANANAGTINSYGNGANVNKLYNNVYGGPGGRGGNWGASGVSGNSGYYIPSPVRRQQSGGAGGAAGVAVSGNPYITWPATGTRYGPIS